MEYKPGDKVYVDKDIYTGMPFCPIDNIFTIVDISTSRNSYYMKSLSTHHLGRDNFVIDHAGLVTSRPLY